MPRRRIIRRWPADDVLELYYSVRTEGGVFSATAFSDKGRRQPSTDPPGWLRRLCDAGLALSFLDLDQREAVEARFLLVLAKKRQRGVLRKAEIQLRDTERYLADARLRLAEMQRRRNKRRQAELEVLVHHLRSVVARRVTDVAEQRDRLEAIRERIRPRTECAEYQDALELLCTASSDVGAHPYSLVARGVLGALKN